MNREKLYDLVQDCFVYDKYGKVTFNLFNFTLLFDDYSDKSVKAVFECLTDNQKEYLKNNFTNFKNFLPPSSYISLNKLNDMITCEFKNTKMRPATEEEQKSVSDGIKSISKPVAMEKSNIVFTDEDISRLEKLHLQSDFLFLQELFNILNEKKSFDCVEKDVLNDLIELNDLAYNEYINIFSPETISKLDEVYVESRNEFLNHLGLDYLVNFEEKFKDKLQKEFDEFIKSVQEEQKTNPNPNYEIQHAYEICWKQEIVFVAEDVCYDNFGIFTKKKLLNTNGILDVIYQEWLNKDPSDINEQISKIISEV